VNDLIVNFTPTGMIPTKEMTPHVPISPQEIIEDVHEAWGIGITMVHLHARTEDGRSTYLPALYEQIIAGIRQFSKSLVICVSLSGRTFHEFHQRAAPLQLDGGVKPDLGSLTLSSVNFNQEASVNSPGMIKALAAEMQKRGILPELEAFDVGMINYAKYLARKGLIRGPHYFNLILGNVACAQADLLHTGLMVRELPPDSYWSMGGVGDSQLPMNAVAIAMGGGVRVGLEDNIWYDQGRTKLARNADLVRRVHKLAETVNRDVMRPSQLRFLLGIPQEVKVANIATLTGGRRC